MTVEIIAKSFGLDPGQLVEVDASPLNTVDAKLDDDDDDDDDDQSTDLVDHAVFRIFHANPAEI